jgi:hypothetical protein
MPAANCLMNRTFLCSRYGSSYRPITRVIHRLQPKVADHRRKNLLENASLDVGSHETCASRVQSGLTPFFLNKCRFTTPLSRGRKLVLPVKP